jgi:hypothetical protein
LFCETQGDLKLYGEDGEILTVVQTAFTETVVSQGVGPSSELGKHAKTKQGNRWTEFLKKCN